MSIRVRFAPSPTGNLHIGGARTALFNYLFAKQKQGTFVLRIEDTDKERSRPEFEQNILEGLKWLGLAHDEFYRQSERVAVYREYLEKLIRIGSAYVSKEETEERAEGKGGSEKDKNSRGKNSDQSQIETRSHRAEVIRLKNPGQKVKFRDLIRGEVAMDTAELDDLVIAKDLDTPIFHFTNALDDLLMGVSHIIRGEDHISNTPRQILVMRALQNLPDWAGRQDLPEYAHIPLILAPDRSKLSKRHGAVSVIEYQTQGYLPEALVNFLATLGWSPQAAGLAREILSLDELIEYFKLEQVQKSGAVFNLEKLGWFNREYLKRLPEGKLLAELKKYLPADDTLLSRLRPEILSRISKFSDLQAGAKAGEWDYFFRAPAINAEFKMLIKNTVHLPVLLHKLRVISADQFTADAVKSAVWDYATEQGRGEVLWPMRVALSGHAKSADPFTIAAIIGREETLARLSHAESA